MAQVKPMIRFNSDHGPYVFLPQIKIYGKIENPYGHILPALLYGFNYRTSISDR
jgi:hypothetical protein